MSVYFQEYSSRCFIFLYSPSQCVSLVYYFFSVLLPNTHLMSIWSYLYQQVYSYLNVLIIFSLSVHFGLTILFPFTSLCLSVHFPVHSRSSQFVSRSKSVYICHFIHIFLCNLKKIFVFLSFINSQILFPSDKFTKPFQDTYICRFPRMSLEQTDMTLSRYYQWMPVIHWLNFYHRAMATEHDSL